ncbi:DNA sulfur modification protein DndB [Paenibacillus elgii]|uniref:DNA sulfur modification protein DndB n=1 Tax=Paenibacillus elgii TaxID=189691 RepID=UPI0013D34723|nr:DNA sulfur modification protein DndB [Paenibacillus elgii]
MATTIACIRGKMGTTEYYLAKIKAGTLIDSVGYASEILEWDDIDIDEQVQRELDDKRVVSDIVPYLVQDPDRFFGSLIVSVYRGWEKLDFEPVTEVVPKIPKAYHENADDLGFITIPDNKRLIALDGQHRLLSLSVAIRGAKGLPAGAKISPETRAELKPNPDLADEDITVIFVPHTDTMVVRKIFNKINRYAKGTSRSDNIITDEDDIYAIITRRIMKQGEVLGSVNGQAIVNWTSNTLSSRSKHLTTISAVYSVTEQLVGKREKKIRPEEKVLTEKTSEVVEYWTEMLERLEVYRKYIDIVDGVEKNIDVPSLREKNLLLKPVTQMAVAIGYELAKEKGLTLNEFVQQLNKIDWSYSNPVWSQVLVVPNTSKVISHKQAINNTGRLIAYLAAGNFYQTPEKEALLNSIRLNNPHYVLPSPV